MDASSRGHAALAERASGARRWSRALVSPWTIAALALASLWVPPLVVVAGFALVSAAALREWQRVTALVYLCVPFQYAFVAADSYGLMTLALPLVAALGLPLWSVVTGDVRSLAERSAQRYVAAMLGVYAVSFVPALLTLDDALALFVVAAALASAIAQSRTRSALVGLALATAVGGLCGLALAALGPFSIAIALAAGAGVGAAAAGGARVMALLGAAPLSSLGAVAFAAPLVYHFVVILGAAN